MHTHLRIALKQKSPSIPHLPKKATVGPAHHKYALGIDDAALHLKFIFPPTYPVDPPRVICCTPLPHANIERTADGCYSLCLDMLEPASSKGTPYSGWSSAMTVHSLLTDD